MVCYSVVCLGLPFFLTVTLFSFSDRIGVKASEQRHDCETLYDEEENQAMTEF